MITKTFKVTFVEPLDLNPEYEAEIQMLARNFGFNCVSLTEDGKVLTAEPDSDTAIDSFIYMIGAWLPDNIDLILGFQEIIDYEPEYADVVPVWIPE